MDKPSIKKIKKHKVKIYSPDNVCLGKADDIQMLDFRIQMIEHPDRLEGYYIVYKGKKHNIGINGSKMESFPQGLFEQGYKLSSKLFGLQKEKGYIVLQNAKMIENDN